MRNLVMQGRLQNTMANIGMVFLHSLVQMAHTSKNVLQVAVGQEEGFAMQCFISNCTPLLDRNKPDHLSTTHHYDPVWVRKADMNEHTFSDTEFSNVSTYINSPENSISDSSLGSF
jgi:hypothetical protein